MDGLLERVARMDPNGVYKARFAELQEQLGRVPSATELLPVHEEYKRAWAPAEETVLPLTREPSVLPVLPLSGPRLIPEPVERRSTPEPLANKPEPLQRLREGSRGPSGGLVLRCHKCGQLWERPRSKGRPSFKCEGCR
jgi:hypothetical protein